MALQGFRSKRHLEDFPVPPPLQGRLHPGPPSFMMLHLLPREILSPLSTSTPFRALQRHRPPPSPARAVKERETAAATTSTTGRIRVRGHLVTAPIQLGAGDAGKLQDQSGWRQSQHTLQRRRETVYTSG